MKFSTVYLFWALLFCLPLQTFGQKNTLSNQHLVKTYTFYKNTDPSLNHSNYFEVMGSEMQLSTSSKMVLTEEETGKNGYTHFKYQQYHDGLPIFGSRYILHEKEGKVQTASGRYSPQVKSVSKPGINPETAIALAKRAMNALSFPERAPEAILCFIDPAFPQTSESLRQAYQVDVQSTEPHDKQRIFVDAATGKIIKKLPLILHEGVPSTGKTKYYGTQNIITDSIAPQSFILRDPTRGEGIFINNSNGGNFTNTSSTWDLTNDEQDEVALDAAYCTQEYYDMMLADYNWQGQDGHGKALKVNVHGGDFVNAYWDGESSTYGDGDCNYGPLTTLEVIGHEFTHGMIDYTSRLIYDSESGGINESLADMFGKMLERKTDPANFSWDLGHSFILGAEGKPFRVMDDPNAVQMPAFYKGLYWVDGNDVHVNSSIGNLWFSMLVDGKQGTNEVGETYNVSALGVDKAGQLVFEVNKFYFTESSDYNAFYQYSVDASNALFGAGSAETQAVKEAWKAVGLPTSGSGTPDVFDLSVVNEWSFGDLYCGLGQYLPVKFKIENRGSIAYDPAMQGTVTLSNFLIPEYTVNLTTPIAPGEIFEIVVDDWLEAFSAGYIDAQATLNLADEVPGNNFGATYFYVTEFENDDISIYADLSSDGCFSTEQYLNVYLTNNSCEDLPAGTSMNITATNANGNIIWSSPYTTPFVLPANSTDFLNFSIPNSTSPLTIAVIYANDPNTDNNTSFDEFAKTYLTITGNYLNTFEVNDGQDEYLALNPGSSDITMSYQNSRYFGSTGLYDNPDQFQRCPDPLSIFDQEFGTGITASINACVDFSSSSAPTLEFDLAQFRNSFSDTSGNQYSSMLQTKWIGNQNGNQIIFGQPEGQVKHHNITLPAFFKGQIVFRLYTEIGAWGLNTSLLDEDDFILIDNVKLSALTTGIDEPTAASPVRISPNPTREMTTIQAINEIKSITLQNVNGQILQTIQVNANSHDLNLKDLANGFYFLNIQLADGQWTLSKVVKMD